MCSSGLRWRPWSWNGAPEGKDYTPRAKPCPTSAQRPWLYKTRLCGGKGTNPRVHLYPPAALGHRSSHTSFHPRVHLYPLKVTGHSSFSLGEESPCLCHTVKGIKIRNQYFKI